jgi:hypothetical protein
LPERLQCLDAPLFAKVFRIALYVLVLLFAWNALVSPEVRRKFRRVVEILAVALIASSLISLGLYAYQRY